MTVAASCPPALTTPTLLMIFGAAIIVILGVVLAIAAARKRRETGALMLVFGIVCAAALIGIPTPASATGDDCAPASSSSSSDSPPATAPAASGALALDVAQVGDVLPAYLAKPATVRLIEDSGNIEQDIPLAEAVGACQNDWSDPVAPSVVLIDPKMHTVAWSAPLQAGENGAVTFRDIPFGTYDLALSAAPLSAGDAAPAGLGPSVSLQWTKTFSGCTIIAEKGQSLTHGQVLGGIAGTLAITDAAENGTTLTFSAENPGQGAHVIVQLGG